MDKDRTNIVEVIEIDLNDPGKIGDVRSVVSESVFYKNQEGYKVISVTTLTSSKFDTGRTVGILLVYEKK